jgi:hypothetical protein
VWPYITFCWTWKRRAEETTLDRHLSGSIPVTRNSSQLLTRRSSGSKPSSSAPVLHCSSLHCSDFLARILVVDTVLCLCKTVFILHIFHCYIQSLIKGSPLTLFAIVLLVACLPVVRATCVWLSLRVFLIMMSVIALETKKFHLFFKSFCFFFIPLFIFENERNFVGFSVCYDWN